MTGKISCGKDAKIIDSVRTRPQIVASLGRDADIDMPLSGDADMIELRLDLIDEPLMMLDGVRRITDKPIIATDRIKSEGGRFEGSEAERIRILSEASSYADWIDIELQAVGRDELLGMIDRPVIISYHDFAGMPSRSELDGILDEMKDAGAKIAKIAVTPSSLKDNLTILDLLLDADMPLCMIGMGDVGRHLRAVAPLYGSVLTYGYVSRAIAPGQMSISELRQTMRMLSSRPLF
jgi:3-dehydroquinate dehydratase-1